MNVRGSFLQSAVRVYEKKNKWRSFDVESGEKKMKVSANTDPAQYNSRRHIFTTR